MEFQDNSYKLTPINASLSKPKYSMINLTTSKAVSIALFVSQSRKIEIKKLRKKRTTLNASHTDQVRFLKILLSITCVHLRLTNRNTEFFRLSQSDWRAVGLNVRMWKIEHLPLFNFALNWTFWLSSSFSHKIAFEQRNVCFRSSRTPQEFSCGSTKQGNYC